MEYVTTLLWRPLNVLEFPSTFLPPKKSAIAKVFLSLDAAFEVVERKFKDTISKGMMWLKANMCVNKMDLKTKMVPLMIILAPK